MSRALSFSLFILTLSLSLAFVLTFAWWRIAVIFALNCLCPLLSVSFLCSLSRSVSLFCHSFLNLARCRSFPIISVIKSLQNRACRSRLKSPVCALDFQKMEIKDLFTCTYARGLFPDGSQLTAVTCWKKYWKNLPFSRNSGQAERKRPNREGASWKNCWERSGENYIVCITFNYYNIMHCDL